MNNNQYDIIFTGGGASCRILLFFLSKKASFKNLSILVIEAQNNTHEKTWCYWGSEDFPLDKIAIKKWSELQFEADKFTIEQQISPYSYACINGRDFNAFFSDQFFDAHQNVNFTADKVNAITTVGGMHTVVTAHQTYSASTIFNSIPAIAFSTPQSLMWQHFEGWFIKINEPYFDEKCAVFMDFSDYNGGPFGFLYMLPFSQFDALVEYAFYSCEVFESAVYETRLRNYLEKKGIKDYTIVRKESGKIPLYEDNITSSSKNGIIHIGSAGGLVKPSTGYAFYRMVEDSRLIAESYGTSSIKRRKRPHRFLFYDRLLLRIIKEDPARAVEIFKQLFNKQPISRILKFLNEDSNLYHEICLFFGLSWWPFLRRIKLFK